MSKETKPVDLLVVEVEKTPAAAVVKAEEKAKPLDIAKAKIITRAAISAWGNEKNKKLFYPAVLAALGMPKAQAIMTARLIDENVDLVEELSKRVS